MRTSTKYIISTIICLLLMLAIAIIMANRWLDYSIYHEPAVICVSVLSVLAVVFFIGYLKKSKG